MRGVGGRPSEREIRLPAHRQDEGHGGEPLGARRRSEAHGVRRIRRGPVRALQAREDFLIPGKEDEFHGLWVRYRP